MKMTTLYAGSIYTKITPKHYRVKWSNTLQKIKLRYFKENELEDAHRCLKDIRTQFGNGCLCTYRQRQYVAGRIVVQSKSYIKQFSYDDTVSSSKMQAQTNAEDWLMMMSEKYNLTRPLEPVKMKSVPLSVRQHIAGFLDGDGCICMYPRGYMAYCFGQSCDKEEPAILKYIQSWYNGKIFKENYQLPNHRVKYQLVIQKQADMWDITRDIVDFLFTKRQQVQLCLDWLRGKRKSRHYYDEGLADKIKNLNTTQNYLSITSGPISDAYVSGLFDAEGCVCFRSNHRLCLELSQPSCPNLLTAIQQYYNFGSVTPAGKYCLTNRIDKRKFIQSILPYSIQKKDQLLKVLPHLDLLDQGIPKRKRMDIDSDIYREVKRLKKE